MIKSSVVLYALLLAGCIRPADKKADVVTRVYSNAVKDSFSIFISLPDDYATQPGKKYPVIYMLDANLYFDIFAVILKKYSEVGLLSPAILVGIGYKDFPTMDSLRNRDYTYPVAIPEYEMSISGQADKFLSFMKNELLPDIDKRYQVDKHQRILAGHSLGGYFALYALQQQLASGDSLFKGYVAASPSLHYNHYYLLNALGHQASRRIGNTKVYTVFGGLENSEKEADGLTTDSIFQTLAISLKTNITFKGESYSNLDHMDTQVPTFIKGLQWILPE
ncbi:alpha/beta hydrolase [Chitinophaga qingshengii]|uniref:Alpha/beta hydrolase n=1 Tax=Chitinophaga qingshengii TaxID=1569794 RepID=A0ABR7TU18_9BACT|nr:alpha/beta hydrolase-fold protein [Chitinophaga qingshengii]MBC9933145.1 alpha/beta hydrolase [Chitinophaga qingshengii]